MLHSPTSQTRTPGAFLRGGGRHLFQAFSTTQNQVCLPLYDTLLPLSHFIHEWERLPGVSPWVLRTVRSGYTLQFGRNPPRFDGVHLTEVNSASKASVLQQELSSLLQKGAIEEVPQTDIERGLFSRYFLVPKRDGGLRPILDLRRLNLSLYKGKFKMLTMKSIMSQIQEGDWFVTIDLKDAFFSHAGHSATQEVPLVCLWREGLPIQGPSLRSVQLFGRLAHSGSLQGAGESSQGYRSPPHSFSWPQNERQEECSLPLSANCVLGGSFGFRSDADPFGSCPGFQFHSMSSPLQARPSCLSEYLPQVARLHGSGLPCVAPRVAPHEAVPLVDERPETTPLINSHSPNQCVAQLISAPCTMRDPAFLQSGVSMGAIHRRHMITTDASMTGWGTVFEGRPAHGQWTGEFLSWHINCLELRAVFLALKHFLPVLGKHHIIVRTDNMAVVSDINHQGGSRSRTLDRLARRLLLWSQGKFLSLRAVHVPGILNSSFAGTYVVKESWRLAGPLCQ